MEEPETQSGPSKQVCMGITRLQDNEQDNNPLTDQEDDNSIPALEDLSEDSLEPPSPILKSTILDEDNDPIEATEEPPMTPEEIETEEEVEESEEETSSASLQLPAHQKFQERIYGIGNSLYLLRYMMGEKGKLELMGSLLLYTTIKFPQSDDLIA